jgi:hypothetical protein
MFSSKHSFPFTDYDFFSPLVRRDLEGELSFVFHLELSTYMHYQYCNELSMTIELDTTLAQAEVLFLSFAQLVADLDRRKAEETGSARTNYLRNRTTNDQTKQTSLGMLKLSDELRELLVSGA